MKEFLLRELHLKIIALLISLTIWFFVTLDRTYLLTRRLPIKFVGLPETKVVSYQSAESIDLTLEGKGKNLLLGKNNKSSYQVVVKDLKSGRQRIRFTPEDLNLGREVVVKGFRPEYLEFEVDDLTEKAVAVKVPLKGEMAKGFFLTKVEVKEKVFLRGPKSELPFVTSLNTESLSLTGLKETTEKELRVIPPDKKFFLVYPKKVWVKLFVEPEVTKYIEDIPVTTDRKGVKITPRRAKILVAGPASLLQDLNRDKVKVFLALNDLQLGVYNLPAQIFLPPGVFFKQCEPAYFRVEIR